MPNPASLRIDPDALPSLRNESTRTQSLYVMQNQFGAVKIGRSTGPIDRAGRVAQLFRCQVKLVASIPQAGHKEEWCHVHLQAHSLGSEWFDGREPFKARLAELLETTLDWPYTLDAAGIERWYARVSDYSEDRYWRNRERKAIRWLLGAVQGLTRQREYLDGDIALLVGYGAVCTANVESGYVGRKGEYGPLTPVPAFTRNLAAAKLLWPEDATRPEPETHDPLRYCLEALCEAWGFDPTRLTPLDTR